MTRQEFLQRIKDNKAVKAVIERLPDEQQKKIEDRMTVIAHYVHDTLLMSAGEMLSNPEARNALSEIITKKHKESLADAAKRPIIKDDDGKPEIPKQDLDQEQVKKDNVK